MLSKVWAATIYVVSQVHTFTTAFPTVSIKNGTIRGGQHHTFGTELFLGIPYAQPPVKDLRFRHPKPLNASWADVKDATTYGSACPGYGGFSANMTLNEDCLTLNILRPAGVSQQDTLPVLVWIYGGGFTGGATSDPRYDLNTIVKASVVIGKPIIAVSMNYRLASFGFLAAKELSELNFGLYDQRLALRWVQENIKAFGGDPLKVTIWGESAGAFSVGFHTTAYDGKHDDLFRAVIMESGTALIPGIQTTFADSYQPYYDNITKSVGCAGTADTLQCLREVPYEAVFNASAPFVFTPVVDGSILPRLPSEAFKRGLVANVSILAGSNTDEGTASFWGPRGTLNSTADVERYISKLGGGLPSCVVQNILSLYPDVPAQGSPFGTGDQRYADQGYQYKRGAAIAGDLYVNAGRRQTTVHHARANNNTKRTVYAYRFDQTPWNGIQELIATQPPVNATHYAEIGFVFNNSNPSLTTWIGPDQAFHDLSGLMSKSWISFVHDLDPNGHGVPNVPKWPEYIQSQELIVFEADRTHVEPDDWRSPQLEYWSSLWSLLLT